MLFKESGMSDFPEYGFLFSDKKGSREDEKNTQKGSLI
jgi:hypothetical protein